MGSPPRAADRRDPQYQAKRGAIALKSADGATPLSGPFVLHPSLAQLLAPYYKSGELLFVHAAGNGYRTPPLPFLDAQDLLESGPAAKAGESDGLAQPVHIPAAGGQGRAARPGRRRRRAPLILRGSVQVASWQPQSIGAPDSDFIAAMRAIYARDPLFGYGAGRRRQDAEFLPTPCSASMDLGDEGQAGGFGPKAFEPLAAAARASRSPPADGPRIAALFRHGRLRHACEPGRRELRGFCLGQ